MVILFLMRDSHSMSIAATGSSLSHSREPSGCSTKMSSTRCLIEAIRAAVPSRWTWLMSVRTEK